MNSQYVNEVAYSCKVSNGIVKIASLSMSAGRDEVKPYYLSRWSRFVATLIEKKGDEKKIVTANIPMREVPAIGIIARNALTAATMEQIISSSEKTETVEIPLVKALKFVPKMGSNKGKPYAEIITSNNYKETITRQRKFLADNVAKYPANQAEIDVIDSILKASANELKSASESVKGSGTVSKGSLKIIYDSGLKPLQSTADEKGICTCYKIIMGIDLSRNYPFFIDIENLKAPVTKTPGGQLNMVLSEAANKQKSVYWFTLQEGLSWITEMENKTQQYEHSTFANQHKIVSDAISAIRNAAKN